MGEDDEDGDMTRGGVDDEINEDYTLNMTGTMIVRTRGK